MKPMKPFSLEAAMRGEPIVCRDGTPAKFVAHVPEAVKSQRVIVQIRNNFGLFHETGWWGEINPHYSDLFMAPKKRTVWVNFYGGLSATFFESESDADDAHNKFYSDMHRIGDRAYPVEIEE